MLKESYLASFALRQRAFQLNKFSPRKTRSQRAKVNLRPRIVPRAGPRAGPYLPSSRMRSPSARAAANQAAKIKLHTTEWKPATRPAGSRTAQDKDVVLNFHFTSKISFSKKAIRNLSAALKGRVDLFCLRVASHLHSDFSKVEARVRQVLCTNEGDYSYCFSNGVLTGFLKRNRALSPLLQTSVRLDGHGGLALSDVWTSLHTSLKSDSLLILSTSSISTSSQRTWRRRQCLTTAVYSSIPVPTDSCCPACRRIYPTRYSQYIYLDFCKTWFYDKRRCKTRKTGYDTGHEQYCFVDGGRHRNLTANDMKKYM